jgi:hypothetical protein
MVVTMTHSNLLQDKNPIKRAWVPKATKHAPLVRKHVRVDHFGNEMPEPHVHEKNSDSIWNTYEALRAAEVEVEALAAKIVP